MINKNWLMLAGMGLACLAMGAQAAGDPVQGRIKADTCMGCHAVATYHTTYPTYNVPKIGGQHAAYIVAALKEYKAGDRKFKTMHANASTLSEQDMEDIAAYISGAADK